MAGALIKQLLLDDNYEVVWDYPQLHLDDGSARVWNEEDIIDKNK